MASPLHAKLGPHRLRFAEYEFDVRTLELTGTGEPLPLQPRPARVLAVLVQAGGEMVTRGELRRQVWGEQMHVDCEQSLKTCIKQIRAALRDDARAPRFVETLPRRGYRFIAPVQWVNAQANGNPVAEPTTRVGGVSGRFSPREMALASIIFVLVLALVMLVLLSG